MTNSITHTPTGLSDILFDEYEMKLKIENTAAEVFKERGYRMVQTPTFEYFDIYDAANPINAENLYKFFDENGRMLALRPDITTSVARLVATKCGNRPLPVRISYSGSAFRNDETFSRAKQREFTQAGVELIGASGAEADAEIIEVAIDVLSRSGIEKFQIDIGQIEFFKGIVEQAGINEKDANKLREIIDSKDFIGIENMISNYKIDDDVKKLLLKLPTLFGGIEIVDECLNIATLNKRSKEALKNIKEVYECLKNNGYEKYLSVDLGLVPNLDYYTGIIIKGFTHGVGFPVCTGGRYDNLTANFGKNMPATGVAIGIERVMEGLNTDSSSSDGNDEYITVALAKGRLGELSVDIFEKLGFDCSEIKSKTRKLIFTDEKNKVKFILVKASDVPTYVEYGAADIGIVGKDTLLESGKNLYEVLDLGFGACKMAVAGPEKMRGKLEGRNIMRVASKYPDIAREYFHRVKGQTVDIIKLNGSVELGPLVGLSEVIVDIVESGRTLKENGLEVLEDVCELSARLVVNRVSLKVKREKIVKIIEDMKGEIK